MQGPDVNRVNEGASWMSKKCWIRLGSSFIGRDISTWGLVPSEKSVWRVEIQESIGWTGL